MPARTQARTLPLICDMTALADAPSALADAPAVAVADDSELNLRRIHAVATSVVRRAVATSVRRAANAVIPTQRHAANAMLPSARHAATAPVAALDAVDAVARPAPLIAALGNAGRMSGMRGV